MTLKVRDDNSHLAINTTQLTNAAVMPQLRQAIGIIVSHDIMIVAGSD